MTVDRFHAHFVAVLVVLCLLYAPAQAQDATSQQNDQLLYDIVIYGGRVMDPESGLDAIRYIGIRDGVIAAVSDSPIEGRTMIDASSLVVAPGFIDTDGFTEHAWLQVMDGVTTVFDIRVGTADVDRWYADREGTMPINYGVGVGYLGVRRKVMGNRGRLEMERNEPTDEEFAEILRELERGFSEGAVALGMGPSGGQDPAGWEVVYAFAVAAEADAHVVATLRDDIWSESNVTANLLQMIGAASLAGVAIHVPHIGSTSGPHAPRMLQVIAYANANGVTVSAEDYPYRAAAITVRAGELSDWSEDDIEQLQPNDSDERLTRETAALYADRDFEAYFHNDGIEPVVVQLLASPLVSIASHGSTPELMPPGGGHPRTSGTYSRVLGRYVREQGVLSLMEALRKMTIMPAERLAPRVPAMRRKGRVQEGADADLVVFDADRILDQATYQEQRVSTGVEYLLVNGVLVVERGVLVEGVLAGRPVRDPDRASGRDERRRE